MFYEPAARDTDVLPHDPFKAIIAPRPVGWISTIGPDGEHNLAPYSFFNAIADTPPQVMFSSDGYKHSAEFAQASGEFTWSLATHDLREAMNETSANLPRGASEWERAGLATAASERVAPPRVRDSPAALECKVTHVHQLRDLDGTDLDRWMVVGQVVGVHIDEHAIRDGRFDTAGVRPIARCGYKGDYAVVDALFDMPRPTS